MFHCVPVCVGFIGFIGHAGDGLADILENANVVLLNFMVAEGLYENVIYAVWSLSDEAINVFF
jgi:hypothetical protein